MRRSRLRVGSRSRSREISGLLIAGIVIGVGLIIWAISLLAR